MAKQTKPKPDNADTNATLAASPTSFMDKDDYYRFRSDLAKVEQQSADQHDKTLVALAGGALAVSITFLEKIAPNPSPDSYSLLALGWLFLVICLCVILLSFLTSQWACQQQMELWDREYRGDEGASQESNAWSATTQKLNLASYLLFVLGVTFVTLFTFVNLGRKVESVQQTLTVPPAKLEAR